MKKIIFLSVVMTFLSTKMFAQTTSYNQSAVVICCPDTVFIDIDNDSNNDIELRGNQFIDSRWYSAHPLNPDMKLASPLDSGQTYSYYNTQATLAQTTMLCYWNNIWMPGTGEKYSGFYIVNAPADTTFGWIRMDFRGADGSCQDTIFVLESAFNTVSNLHLNAGERLSSTSIENNFSVSEIEIYPNPAENILNININTKASDMTSISIFNNLGVCVLNKEIFNKISRIDVSEFPDGIYFVELKIGNEKIIRKLVKR